MRKFKSTTFKLNKTYQHCISNYIYFQICRGGGSQSIYQLRRRNILHTDGGVDLGCCRGRVEGLASAAPPAVRARHQVLTAHTLQVELGRTQAALYRRAALHSTVTESTVHLS